MNTSEYFDRLSERRRERIEIDVRYPDLFFNVHVVAVVKLELVLAPLAVSFLSDFVSLLHSFTPSSTNNTAMLPPVDPDTLENNPKFDALFRDLCTNKLDDDGATKLDAKTQQERDAFSEQLRKARVAVAKQNLIKSYLQHVAYKGDDLPSEVHTTCCRVPRVLELLSDFPQLQELVAIIAAALQTQLSKDDAGLLRDDVEKFKVRFALRKRGVQTLTRRGRKTSSSSPSWYPTLPPKTSQVWPGSPRLQHPHTGAKFP